MRAVAAAGHSPFSDLSAWEWAVAGAAAVAAAWVIWLAVKWTFRPGETDPSHPKRSILDEDS